VSIGLVALAAIPFRDTGWVAIRLILAGSASWSIGLNILVDGISGKEVESIAGRFEGEWEGRVEIGRLLPEVFDGTMVPNGWIETSRVVVMELVKV
jgi:hypothetical protein